MATSSPITSPRAFSHSSRAEVISALLPGARGPARGHVPAVRLRGARVTGVLNVSGGEVGCELRLEHCVLEERPDFSNARARQMRLSACASCAKRSR